MQQRTFNRRAQNLIANLRGAPEDRSFSYLRETVALSDVLEKVMKRYNIESSGTERMIIKHWKQIMGSRVAHRCSPERIVDDRELIVYTSSTSLKQELEFQKRTILKALQKIPACQQIQSIRFRIG